MYELNILAFRITIARQRLDADALFWYSVLFTSTAIHMSCFGFFSFGIWEPSGSFQRFVSANWRFLLQIIQISNRMELRSTNQTQQHNKVLQTIIVKWFWLQLFASMYSRTIWLHPNWSTFHMIRYYSMHDLLNQFHFNFRWFLLLLLLNQVQIDFQLIQKIQIDFQFIQNYTHNLNWTGINNGLCVDSVDSTPCSRDTHSFYVRV